MNIFVINRVRNEERNIERFCMSYQWADRILIADGGSEDKTIEIARSIPKVTVKNFGLRVQMENGLWRNPQAEHINFMIRWAEREGADWIIFDDCDCFPNYLLKQNARSIIEDTDKKFIKVTRLYLWGEDQHLIKMAQPARPGEWYPSLWAWRAGELRAQNTDMAFMLRPKINLDEVQELLPPYCLLHNSWPNKEEVDRKLNFYRRSGQIKNMLHPLDPSFGGVPVPLPDWARE